MVFSLIFCFSKEHNSSARTPLSTKRKIIALLRVLFTAQRTSTSSLASSVGVSILEQCGGLMASMVFGNRRRLVMNQKKVLSAL
jgi:hypothetical protein